MSQLNVFENMSIWLPILFVLFIISMINVVVYTYRKRKKRERTQKTIVDDGFMKLYLQLKHGKGELVVVSVDGKQPLYSSEVLQKAIFLSPGLHNVILSGKVKDAGLAENILPYYTKIEDVTVNIMAKKDAIAILNYDVRTQNFYIEESEERK